LRLFCFPYAGGGASIFRSWPAALGPAVDVHAIRLPGRETRIAEPPLVSVPALAEMVASEIAPLLDRPFAFFGCSFGSLVAFETARVLRKQNLTPVRLFIAALKAPQLPLRRKQIHDLPADEFAQEVRNFKGTPEAVLQNPELMSLILPAVRADFRAYETYSYETQEPLDCPITVMGGLADPSVSQPELVAWNVLTSTDFAMRMFPGDHFFIHGARGLLTWTILRELLEPLRAAS
jgi:surfactin synthase thioesterase subunit